MTARPGGLADATVRDGRGGAARARNMAARRQPVAGAYTRDTRTRRAPRALVVYMERRQARLVFELVTPVEKVSRLWKRAADFYAYLPQAVMNPAGGNARGGAGPVGLSVAPGCHRPIDERS